MNGRSRLIAVLLVMVVAGLIPGLARAQMTEANIHFQATEVFLNNEGELIVTGTFQNYGNRTGFGIVVPQLTVFRASRPSEDFDDYQFVVSDSFQDQNLGSRRLGPGQTLRWSFNFGRATQVRIQHWWVQSRVTYKW